MCNLYSITKGQKAIIELLKATPDSAGNMPPLPASLPTNALPGGMLVNFYMPQYGESGATMVFYFPRQAAMEFMTYIVQAGEQTKWWDSDFELIPGRGLN